MESGERQSTKLRVMHWFVRGGSVRAPDGSVTPVDVDPVVIGREEGVQIVLADRR